MIWTSAILMLLFWAALYKRGMVVMASWRHWLCGEHDKQTLSGQDYGAEVSETASLEKVVLQVPCRAWRIFCRT